MSNKYSIEVENQTQPEERDSEAAHSGEVVTSQADRTVDSDTEAKQPKAQLKKRRKWLAILGAIVLLVGGVGGWRWWQASDRSESPVGQSQSQATPVRLATVESGTLEESSEFVANLESRQAVTLLPQIQGRVSRILVSPGDEVRAGATLIQIDPDEQQAAVSGSSAAAAAARAQVENARANLRSLEAERLSNQSNLKLSQQQYERYSSLAGQGAVSRETRDQYLNELQAARSSLAAINKQIEAQQAAVAQTQEALQQAQANVKQSQVQLQYFQVNAPFAGTVGDIPVKVGDLVTTSTQLTTVTQNQPLEVNISIPLQRASQVEIGTPVELLNAQGEVVGTSRVFFISPQTANDTQSVLIKARFDNAKGQLRADSFVRARVIWNERPGVLVPTTAVTRIGGQAFVYVAQPAPQQPEPAAPQPQSSQPSLVAEQRPVELGSIQNNNYQVLTGLKPGERIVVSGLLNLRNGAAIAPAAGGTEEAERAGQAGQRG